MSYTAADFKVDLNSFVWPSPSDSDVFWDRSFFPSASTSKGKDVSLDQGIPTEFERGQSAGPIHTIVHVTAEMAPIAKVGGLGDAVAGLARSCYLEGHNVEVVLPFYESIVRIYIITLYIIEYLTSI